MGESFVEKLNRTIQAGDKLIIERTEAPAQYHIEVQTKDEKLGLLRGERELSINDAIPSRLVKAIAEAKADILLTQRMVEKTQASHET